jgi:hypothetical protein
MLSSDSSAPAPAGATATDLVIPPREKPYTLPENCPDDDDLAGHFLWKLAEDYQWASDLHRWITRDGDRWVVARDGVLPFITACVAMTELDPKITPAIRKASHNFAQSGNGDVYHAREGGGITVITAHQVRMYELAERLRNPAQQARIAAMMARKAPFGDGGMYDKVAVDTTELDASPGVLWAGGIPWDLAASFTEPVPFVYDDGSELWLTEPHMLSANYRPDVAVPTPVWDKLTAAIFPDELEREHALHALSHGLHGWPGSAAILARAATGTGKSFLASLMSDLLGDYAGSVAAKTLFGRGGNSQFAFDEMHGARFVVMNEGRKADFESTEAFKAVVSPDPLVNARARHERHRRLIPNRATLMLTVNPAADLDYSDPAVVRRLIPAGFAGRPAEIAAIAAGYGTNSEQGYAAWQAEAPGVLAKMMRRCAYVLGDHAYRGTREDAPESVMERFAAVAAEADPFGRWFDERTREGWFTTNDDLRDDYERWCTVQHEPQLNPTRFGRKMAERGVERAKPDRDTRGWRIALR